MSAAGTQTSSPDPIVLGQLMAAENLLHALPSDRRISEFCAGVIRKIPGMADCSLCIHGTLFPPDNDMETECRDCPRDPASSRMRPEECAWGKNRPVPPIPLETSSHTFGFLFVEVGDSRVSGPYMPFIRNFANHIAIHLENRFHRRRLEEANEELRVHRDTLEKRVREKTASLRESEEKFAKAFRNAPLLMTITSVEDGRFLDVNDAFVRVTGYGREQALGSTTTGIGFLTEEDRRRMIEILRAEGRVRDLEFVVKRADRSKIVVLYSGEVIEVEGRKRVLSTATDITRRKQTEAALRESEARLSDANTLLEEVLAHTHMMAAFLDPQFRFIWVNRAYAETCRQDPSFFPGKNHFDLYPDEENRAIFQQVADTGEPFWAEAKPFEFPDQPDRGVTYWDWSLIPVKDSAGDVTGLVFTLAEVTKRVLAEEAFREKEKNYRLLADNATDLIWIRDMDLNLTYVSPSVRAVRGFSPEEAMAQRLDEVLAPDSCRCATEAFTRFLQTLESGGELSDEYTVDLEYRCKDGGTVWMECAISLLRDRGGEPVGILGVSRDVTDRKRAEEALRVSEERFRLAFRTSPDSINLNRLDDGVYIDINEGFTKIMGYTREEVIGSSSLSLNIWQDPGDRDRLVRGLREKGYVENLEARFVRKGGRIRYGLMSARVLKIGGQEVILSITRDITELKQAEEERKKWEERLRESQKMEAIGTLAGGIAHDFNNILGIIVGNTELAMQDLPERSPARESLGEVRNATLRARDLVNQILLFARQKEHTISSVRVEPVVRESLKMIRASIPTTVEIDMKVQDGLPPVQADPAHLQQITMNLCANAGHVMEADGGMLTLSLDRVDLTAPLSTSTGTLGAGRYVRMEVRDTGPGIDPDHRDRIFEPFFTTKGVGEGTGLGLAVVHGIVQDRGGGITVESEAGKGTSFTVYLPASEKEPGDEPPEEKEGPARGAGEILFVDDEPMIMRLGQRILERQGYGVETRASGSDALECFRRDPDRFDLVVTDMTMPGMRGDHLAEAILAIRPDMPIILTTGYSTQISEERALAMGIRAFVMKPLTAGELTETVRRVLDER